MNEEFILSEGWLKKEEENILTTTWKLKYFQLIGSTIYQYPKPPSKPKLNAEWTVNLSKFLHVQADPIKPKSGDNNLPWNSFFRLQFDNTEIDFSCETLQSCKEWMISLNNCLPKEKQKHEVKIKKSENEKKLEDTVTSLINVHGKKSNVAECATWILTRYKKWVIKTEQHRLNQEKYFFELHKRIKKVENSGEDFSDEISKNLDRLSYHFLELLNIYEALNMKRLEKKEEFLRWQVQKILNDPKLVPKFEDYKKEILESYMIELKDILPELKNLEEEIEQIRPQLVQKFKDIASKYCEKKKKKTEKYQKLENFLYKLMSKTPDEEIVVINNVKEKLVESFIQLITKKKTLLILKIDTIENLFEKNKEIPTDYLYLNTSEFNKEFWNKLVISDQRCLAVNVLVEHLKIERKTNILMNVSQYKTKIENLITHHLKKMEDTMNIIEALELELKDQKTSSIKKKQYNYLIFAELKLEISKKALEKKKLKRSILVNRKKEILVAETEINNIKKIEMFEFITFTQKLCLYPWQDLHKDFKKEKLNFVTMDNEIKKLKNDLQSIKVIMAGMKEYSGQKLSIYELFTDQSTVESKYLMNLISRCKMKDPFYMNNAKAFMIELTNFIFEKRKTEKNEIYATVEKHLFDQTHEEFLVFFEDQERDKLFISQSQLYNEVMLYDLLKLDKETFLTSYSEGIHLLKQIESHITPSSKLISIYVALKRIMEIIETQKIGVICTDDFLPICICSIAFSGVKNVFSQIKFIRELAQDVLLLNEQGYFLSSLESAATFIIDYKIEQKQPTFEEKKDL